MIKTLRVILWDEEIGRLAWDEWRRLSYFTYNPEFVKKGLNVSPLVAPVSGVRALAPVWGEDAKIYQRLPSFLADSGIRTVKLPVGIICQQDGMRFCRVINFDPLRVLFQKADQFIRICASSGERGMPDHNTGISKAEVQTCAFLPGRAPHGALRRPGSWPAVPRSRTVL